MKNRQNFKGGWDRNYTKKNRPSSPNFEREEGKICYSTCD